MRANDSTMSVGADEHADGGDHDAGAEDAVDPAVGDAPAPDRAGDPAGDEQEAEERGRLGLREAELVLVEARHPRADRGHDEADGRHADERVAQRRDVQDHPHVAVEARDHLLGEDLDAVGEQRLELSGRRPPSRRCASRAPGRPCRGCGSGRRQHIHATTSPGMMETKNATRQPWPWKSGPSAPPITRPTPSPA